MCREERNLFEYKKQSFSNSKKSHFSKGVNPCKKCQFLLYLDLVKIRLKIMLKQFAEEKETFLSYKKQKFQKSKNSHFCKGAGAYLFDGLLKGVNPSFWSEKCQFFLHLFLVKTRLEIIFNAFVEKKETFFDYNNKIFSKSQKSLFPKGLTHVLVKKCQFFLLI